MISANIATRLGTGWLIYVTTTRGTTGRPSTPLWRQTREIAGLPSVRACGERAAPRAGSTSLQGRALGGGGGFDDCDDDGDDEGRNLFPWKRGGCVQYFPSRLVSSTPRECSAGRCSRFYALRLDCRDCLILFSPQVFRPWENKKSMGKPYRSHRVRKGGG